MEINRHVLFDKVLLMTFRYLGSPFFSRSIDSPPLLDHLAAVTFDRNQIGDHGEFEFIASSLAPAVSVKVNVFHNAGALAPVILYNMGGGEAPYDGTIKRAYPASEDPGVSIVAIEAPWQRDRAQLANAFEDLNTYMAMLAITIRMNEWLLRSDQFSRSPRKVIAGTSLGGFVCNRHHLEYNSADAYVPLVAGTLHGEIFLSTIRSSKLVTDNPCVIRKHLNFQDQWDRAPHNNVYAQLGRYDQLNQLEVQGPSYGNAAIDIWEGGHMYHVIHPTLLRKKLDAVIAQT